MSRFIASGLDKKEQHSCLYSRAKCKVLLYPYSIHVVDYSNIQTVISLSQHNCDVVNYFNFYVDFVASNSNGVFQSISGRFQKRGRKRTERLDESKHIQTTPTRTYCKRSRPLPYCYHNCRTPRHWNFTQHLGNTRPPLPPPRPK